MHNYGPEGEGKRQRLVLQPPRPSATCIHEGCAGDVAEAAAVIGECDVRDVSRTEGRRGRSRRGRDVDPWVVGQCER